jgi:hypothetical protein
MGQVYGLALQGRGLVTTIVITVEDYAAAIGITGRRCSEPRLFGKTESFVDVPAWGSQVTRAGPQRRALASLSSGVRQRQRNEKAVVREQIQVRQVLKDEHAVGKERVVRGQAVSQTPAGSTTLGQSVPTALTPHSTRSSAAWRASPGHPIACWKPAGIGAQCALPQPKSNKTIRLVGSRHARTPSRG